MEAQEGHEDMAEDDLMLSTSQNAWRKGQTQYRGRTREKAANMVVQNPTSDRPILQTMLFNFPNYPQPLEVWIDKTGLRPRKWNWHVDTKREVITSIKGRKERRKGRSPVKEDKNPTKREKGKDTRLLGRNPRT